MIKRLYGTCSKSKWNLIFISNKAKKTVLTLLLCTTMVFSCACSQENDVNEYLDYILTHEEEYPEELVALVERNSEAADFVYQYHTLVAEGKNSQKYGKKLKLTDQDADLRDGLLLQWDERWGAVPYGMSMMALSGCGPTCLSMASLILTGSKENTPAKIAAYAMDNGYYMKGQGTSWDLFNKGCKAFGMTSEKISVSEKKVKTALKNGAVLIASVKPGDFTSTGHFIVIDGYDDGELSVKDPNSIERSNMIWQYDEVETQIKCLWALYKE